MESLKAFQLVEFLALQKQKVQLQKDMEVEEQSKKHKSNEMEVPENLCDDATDDDDKDGSIQQGKIGKTDNQQFAGKENKEWDSGVPALHLKGVKTNENKSWTSEESVMTSVFEETSLLTGGLLQVDDDRSLSVIHQDEGRSAEETPEEKNTVKTQILARDDLDVLTQSSEIVSEDCELPSWNCKNFMSLIEQLGMDCKDSVSLLKIQDAVLSYERLIELKKNHCEQLTVKIKKMENKVSVLQKELSETKEIKSQLEYQKVSWEQEVCSLRFTLKQEEEKKRNAYMLYEKIREQLRRKEEEYSKEVEVKQQLELTLRTLNMELRTVRNNLDQVIQERNDTQKQLSQEQNAKIMQDEILNNHLCKQKNLEMALKKMNSEISHSHEKDLLHKNRMLENEIAGLRLEIDTIKKHIQEIEKKYFKDIKMVKEKNDDLQNTMKLNEEALIKTVSQYSGQLHVLTTQNMMLNSKLKNEKQNKERLETEVESYRSRLAAVLRDRDESQILKRHLELSFQRARDEWFELQDEINRDISNLKDKNVNLSQQLPKAKCKFDSLEIELSHTRDTVRQKTSVLELVQGDLSQTQCQMEEIEHMYQNEQGKVKHVGKESVNEGLSQLHSENTLLRQQLEDAHNKADDNKKKLINIQDQCHSVVKNRQAEGERQKLVLQERNELIHECDQLKERLHQYEKEEAEREVVLRQRQQERGVTLKNLPGSDASLEVASHSHTHVEDETEDSKKKLDQSRGQIDNLTAELQTASLKCQHLKAKNQILQQELLFVKTIQKKCEKLQKKKNNLEQEVVNLRSHMGMNMVERGQVEQYKREIEERARQDIGEKLKEVNLFLQAQAASQGNLEQLREDHISSIHYEMELRIKAMESEMSKMKTQEEFNKAELEQYKQLYQKELKDKQSLSDKLNKSHEKLAEVRSELLVEQEKNRSLRHSHALTSRPVLESPSFGSLNDTSVLNRTFTPRENLVIATSSPRTSRNSLQNYFTMMQLEFEKNITRELEEGMLPKFMNEIQIN
ncbi:PREDICTED: ankyrin repeat domain-containing protein 26-like [Propithecus coquereli]|uniref:ankyrin repeat domain-containing protein 26-like n=1 Tax=Propithecus coquereli TaxID=379532 RepID=UPI00063F639E|nr:PREDICTED: ankyrin repeat domain-containing protein 26-like [Propithecus coquereli]